MGCFHECQKFYPSDAGNQRTQAESFEDPQTGRDPCVKMIDRVNTQAPEGDSESRGADTNLEAEDRPSCNLTPIVPGNALRTDLRKKYLPQVDILLQDAEYFKNAEKEGGKDTVVISFSSVTSPVTPAHGCQDGISAKSVSGPEVSASSSRDQAPSCPGPADMTTVTTNDSFSLLGTSTNSVSNQTFEVDDVCSATISDLYEGMMHAMSRLLCLKPSCIISTKTHVNQNWKLKRRLTSKHGVHRNMTYCHRSKASQRRSRKEPVPCSEPRKEARILRDSKNLLHVAPPRKTDLELKSVSLEGSQLQVHKFSPAHKELQMMPQKYLDLNLDPENRVKELQWLISPVKMFPRRKVPPGQVEKYCREIKNKFDKLHEEYCLSSGKQPCLTGPTESCAANLYRSGSKSPGNHQDVKTHRPSLPFSREKIESPAEGFEDLRVKSVKTESCLLKSVPSPEDSLSRSPDHSQQRSGLLQEHYSESIGRAVGPSTTISAPGTGSAGCGKNNYDELKREFNRLYQKYCLASPQRVRVRMTLHDRASPVRAAAAAPSWSKRLKRLNPDSPLQSSQTWSTSPGWHTRIPQDSAVLEAHESATKRRRLSYPVLCDKAGSLDSSEAAGWP
ncbi:Holliday junction recognition protein isoform X1 [Apodemus sylvaticus]|uniref:Holliday junction recognition protein isoform X1 n=1 Tax=Apodemus sylvaticus TaxID=10129 RepID=UPI002243C1B8|nr:Holliday junction recognition protein isoform X1 [Apodemus sylvaticus]